eukprot:gnl/Hemi2/21765_TR7266_c1_g1_i1.p2 gnl/Hemi2/21765_TR7266_c1_g1~~gnl/Hemi2/21765_TR7266_c1_g1_i1.p2  ORF type:complete len:211 (-),score=12.09 gnl/Hemi2/21765_TR7266_c1_g1_i1:452-1084(-)
MAAAMETCTVAVEDCSKPITSRSGEQSSFTAHVEPAGGLASDCWNCISSEPPARLRLLIRGRRLGWFCSHECKLRYALERFALGERVFSDIHKEAGRLVAPAPEVSELRRFGGSLSLEDYRETFGKQSFISYDAQMTPLKAHTEVRTTVPISPPVPVAVNPRTFAAPSRPARAPSASPPRSRGQATRTGVSQSPVRKSSPCLPLVPRRRN